MPQTGLHGPHLLNSAAIDAAVKGVGVGAYALGYMKGQTFEVHYVGRSDTDLKKRLKDHVLEPYTVFKFGFLPNASAAFVKECELYHDFGMAALDNDKHPDAPKNSALTCPRCPKNKT